MIDDSIKISLILNNVGTLGVVMKVGANFGQSTSFYLEEMCS